MIPSIGTFAMKSRPPIGGDWSEPSIKRAMPTINATIAKMRQRVSYAIKQSVGIHSHKISGSLIVVNISSLRLHQPMVFYHRLIA